MDKSVNIDSKDVHFLSFNNRKVPVFVEMKDKEWIKWGEKNDFPYYLNTLYQRSSFHSAIVNAKVNYIAGRGLTYDRTGVVTIEQKSKAENIIKQPFGEYDLNEVILRVTKDYELFNNFAYLVRWSKNKQSATIEHIDVCNLRANADKTKFAFTRGWYLWKNGKKVENKNYEQEKDWKVYKAYDPKDRTGDQIYFYAAFSPDQYVYGIPVYQGANTWIENHISYSDFQYKNITSSFSPAMHISIIGTVPTEDKQDEIIEGITNNYSGAEGNRLVVGFYPSAEQGVKIDPINIPDQSQIYETVAEQSMLNIFTCHEFPKLLLGVTQEGALGQRNEMMALEESFFNKYVLSRQRAIVAPLNVFAKDLNIPITFQLNRVKSVDWIPDDATIASVLGSSGLKKIIDEKVGYSDTSKPTQSELTRQILSAMSPLLANKVLESMTAEEIRGLAGLSGSQTTTTVTKQVGFSYDKQPDLQMFLEFGEDASLYDVVTERDIETTDSLQIELSEKDYLSMSFADIKLVNIDRSVLDLLSKDGFMPVEEISKVVKVSPSEVKDSIARLLERELIHSGKEKIAGDNVRSYEVSNEGSKALSEKPAKTESIKVMYRYDVAKGMPSVITNSRPFCEKLMAMNKLYTRDEINTMSDREGRNVWSLRGGWYHNPKTGVNTPQCRHTWRQVVVREK